MTSVPYILTFLAGSICLRVLTFRKESLSPVLFAALSLSLGVGISTLLTFVSFLVNDRYHLPSLMSLHVFFIAFFTAVHFFQYKRSPLHRRQWSFTVKDKWTSAIFILVWGLLYLFIDWIAQEHPFGEWDAWALYNMKMKFLLFAGEGWRAIFNELHWHTQPDYPLLLPMFNAWGSAFLGSRHPFHAPYLTGLLITFSTGLMIYGGLRKFLPAVIAFFISCVFLLNPYTVFLATSQYADTMFSFFLLSACVCFFHAVHRKSSVFLFLSALYLGFLSFTKNEGIVLLLIFSFLAAGYLLWRRETIPLPAGKILGIFAAGLLISVWPTIVYKLFFAPPNRDILVNINRESLNYFNVNGLRLVLTSWGNELMKRRWSSLWFFVIILGLIRLPRMFRKENLVITSLFVIYGAVLIVVYLTTTHFDLAWRLKSTIPRIMFYCLPSVLVFFGYLYKKETRTT